MVRLVFRPYTQIRRSICTLESLRASTRVSPGFALHRHSSPSFGSQQICSHSNLSSENHDRSMVRGRATRPLPPQAPCGALHFHCARRVCHPSTRIVVRLLGPCFKTGRAAAFRQHPACARPWVAPAARVAQLQTAAGPTEVGAAAPPARRFAAGPPTHADTGRSSAWSARYCGARPPASLLAISSPLYSLFKVLFIFPSRYLFAIGLLLIFSFRWSLPPTWSCTRKQLDSSGRSVTAVRPGRGRDCHPRWSPVQWELSLAPAWRRPSRLQFDRRAGRQTDLHVELLPLHSQLLGESWLVSFPPLNNMLKSSGSSYLISGQRGRGARARCGVGGRRAFGCAPGARLFTQHRAGRVSAATRRRLGVVDTRPRFHGGRATATPCDV